MLIRRILMNRKGPPEPAPAMAPDPPWGPRPNFPKTEKVGTLATELLANNSHTLLPPVHACMLTAWCVRELVDVDGLSVGVYLVRGNIAWTEHSISGDPMRCSRTYVLYRGTSREEATIILDKALKVQEREA